MKQIWQLNRYRKEEREEEKATKTFTRRCENSLTLFYKPFCTQQHRKIKYTKGTDE